jgi:hypothetical protein
MDGNHWQAWRAVLQLCAVAALVGASAAATYAQSTVAPPAAATSKPADTAPSNAPTKDKQVLRHAVFFKFKDGTSAEDVRRVVEAFGALPAKIPVIAAYEWGENTGPANFGNGLTHCFLLTFRDEAGRAAYLPHADHKAFGSVLGPHLDRVFVIDYWAAPQPQEVDHPLRHLVFLKFKDSASPADVRALEEAFAALPSKIDAIKGFEWGRNNSPETHDEGFTHCFTVTFDSDEGLAEYAKHPDHAALAEMIGPIVDKVRVIDYWAKPADANDVE